MMEKEKEKEKKKLTSHCWWFDSHNNTNIKTPPWLQSTLAELEEKTQAMLKVIEEDADSFAQRAEMYYKKRPELISMVEDFYRAHRSLAERYDLVNVAFGNRLVSPGKSPVLSYSNSRSERSIRATQKSYDSYSEAYALEDRYDSEVDDTEEEEEVSCISVDDEMTKLKEGFARLKLENRIQRERLVEKDEEKREVIRQLTLAMDMLREEKSKLREISKKQNSTEFNKLKGVLEEAIQWVSRTLTSYKNTSSTICTGG